MEWLAIDLPHNSSHLFARLPFGDAVQLAALVGTGQMTWAQINAALDARIKLAIARQRGGPDTRVLDPDQTWQAARRTREDEIWARYHAKCDAVFAEDTDAVSTDPWSREQLRDRERILERLRSERDQALAALNRRMGPPGREMSAARMESAIIARTQLAATEADALRKLDATGFVGSRSMADAIRRLAMPLIGLDPPA